MLVFSIFLVFVVLELLFLFFLFYSALLDASFSILCHVVSDELGGVLLQIVLHLSKVLEAQFHPVHTYVLPVLLPDRVATHSLL